jgi:hypothetical protein
LAMYFIILGHAERMVWFSQNAGGFYFNEKAESAFLLRKMYLFCHP